MQSRQDSSRLTDDELRVNSSLTNLGWKIVSSTQSKLEFERSRPESLTIDEWLISEKWLPRVSLSELIRQTREQVIQHPGVEGFVIPRHGYAEIVLHVTSFSAISISYEDFFSGTPDEGKCRHGEGNQLPMLPYSPSITLRKGPLRDRIHVPSSKSSEPCLELSNASPLAMLLYSRRTDPQRLPLLLTAKIDYGIALDESALIDNTDRLTHTLVYELDARNGFVVAVESGVSSRSNRAMARRRTRATEIVRYPRLQVDREVSSLFNFASQAGDNLPLAFLSYYRALEHFMPIAVRQRAYKEIRDQLSNPNFDPDRETCLFGLVAAATKSVNAQEKIQFQMLIREYIPLDRLTDFLSQDWGDHFSPGGPIRAVKSIDIMDASKLSVNVADRIYGIRNRIVHAKDDPRYSEEPALLPRSKEADALGPDVLLVRFLATEAISHDQSSGTSLI
jgi:hypothetical protein